MRSFASSIFARGSVIVAVWPDTRSWRSQTGAPSKPTAWEIALISVICWTKRTRSSGGWGTVRYFHLTPDGIPRFPRLKDGEAPAPVEDL